MYNQKYLGWQPLLYSLAKKELLTVFSRFTLELGQVDVAHSPIRGNRYPEERHKYDFASEYFSRIALICSLNTHTRNDLDSILEQEKL